MSQIKFSTGEIINIVGNIYVHEEILDTYKRSVVTIITKDINYNKAASFFIDGSIWSLIDGKTYICKREGEEDGGTINLQYLPHEVIGQYFELL